MPTDTETYRTGRRERLQPAPIGEFAEEINKRLRARGMTGVQLAGLVDLPQPRMSEILRGLRRFVTYGTLCKIAEVLKTTPGRLLPSGAKAAHIRLSREDRMDDATEIEINTQEEVAERKQARHKHMQTPEAAKRREKRRMLELRRAARELVKGTSRKEIRALCPHTDLDSQQVKLLVREYRENEGLA